MIDRGALSEPARGFAMIEVLVALALVLIGMLGIVGLQARAHQGEMESYQRTQALLLMRDMVDRLETHRQAASCFGQITTGAGTPYLGTNANYTPVCIATGVPTTDQAAIDSMNAWSDLLVGVAEVSGTTKVGALIDAVGCVARDAGDAVTPDAYTVAVAWQGLSDFPVSTPAADAPAGERNAAKCGYGLFGSEARRRVVWTTVEQAKLR